MALKRKDLLTIRDLPAEEITLILDTAESMKEIASRDIKKVPALRGKTVINLFYEPSTRTRTSFEIAGKWLSADVINISSAASSVAKGESLLDTGRTLQAMHPDVVVIRHAAAGAPQILAEAVAASVINAGDGAHEHPTQALLDLFTIRERFGRLSGLKAAIVGDIAHSRVARSNLHGMRKMGMEVRLCGPATLLPRYAEQLGAAVTTKMEEAIRDVDIIMMLRIQHERMGSGFL
ncbi:MAG: aspartate carbamoyltransferase catalytic subunit, partial [Candidatus Methylomirabilales bacterium]